MHARARPLMKPSATSCSLNRLVSGSRLKKSLTVAGAAQDFHLIPIEPCEQGTFSVAGNSTVAG